VTGGTRAYARTHGVLLFDVCFANDGGPFADADITTGFVVVAPTDGSNPRLVCPGFEPA
jgi:hypothetical protein